MVSRNGQRSPVPPYVAYKTFKEFVRELPEGAQAAVDQVVWNARFGDRSAAQLAAALKFLDLVQPNGDPAATCLSLAIGSSKEKRATLAQIIEGKYGEILETLANGSARDLERKFQEVFGVTGETVRRCVTFLLHAAADLGLPVSPFIMKGRRATLPDDRLWSSVRMAAGEIRDGDEELVAPLAGVPQHEDGLNRLDPALRGLLLKLPTGRALTSEEKRSWKLALEAVFDLIYPTDASASGSAAFAH